MKLKRILKWSARAILLALILAFLAGFITYWRSTNDCDQMVLADLMQAGKMTPVIDKTYKFSEASDALR